MSTNRKQVTTYLPAELYARLEAAARADGRTVSAMVERLLAAALAAKRSISAESMGGLKGLRPTGFRPGLRKEWL